MPRKNSPAVLISIYGLVARGLVFGIVGVFFLYAAFTVDPDQAGGMADALAWVQGLPFGRVIYAVVALGLAAFGIYNFVEARHRRIRARRCAPCVVSSHSAASADRGRACPSVAPRAYNRSCEGTTVTPGLAVIAASSITRAITSGLLGRNDRGRTGFTTFRTRRASCSIGRGSVRGPSISPGRTITVHPKPSAVMSRSVSPFTRL